jgi:hypothetical protein
MKPRVPAQKVNHLCIGTHLSIAHKTPPFNSPSQSVLSLDVLMKVSEFSLVLENVNIRKVLQLDEKKQ